MKDYWTDITFKPSERTEENSAVGAKVVMLFSCKFLFGCKWVHTGHVWIIPSSAGHAVVMGTVATHVIIALGKTIQEPFDQFRSVQLMTPWSTEGDNFCQHGCQARDWNAEYLNLEWQYFLGHKPIKLDSGLLLLCFNATTFRTWWAHILVFLKTRIYERYNGII